MIHKKTVLVKNQINRTDDLHLWLMIFICVFNSRFSPRTRNQFLKYGTAPWLFHQDKNLSLYNRSLIQKHKLKLFFQGSALGIAVGWRFWGHTQDIQLWTKFNLTSENFVNFWILNSTALFNVANYWLVLQLHSQTPDLLQYQILGK